MNDVSIKLFPFDVKSPPQLLPPIPNGISMISAPEFWAQGNKGRDINIAIIDTGCDTNHFNLKDRIVKVRNFTPDDQGHPKIVTDYCGHGTHVAGTIAASHLSQGIIGVAPEANLYILKALSGKNGTGTHQWVISAIDYAISQKVDIITMSLGSPIDVPELHHAIQNAVNHNILIVCAAGNEGAGDVLGRFENISYPAYYNEVISVGAVDYQAYTTLFTNSNTQLDLVAPGKDILSTYPNNKFAVLSGTSMAAPHVTGALALIINWAEKEFNRTLTESELYAQLMKRTLGLNYNKSVVGNGLLYLPAPDVLENLLSLSKFVLFPLNHK